MLSFSLFFSLSFSFSLLFSSLSFSLFFSPYLFHSYFLLYLFNFDLSLHNFSVLSTGPHAPALESKRANLNHLPSFSRVYLFLYPSWKTCLSNCQGLPSSKCLACIGTTSHNTSLFYLPIEKEISTCLITLTSPHSFSHCKLYSLGCFKVGKFNFSNSILLAAFA